MPSGTLRLGEWGEEVATRHLESSGWKVLHRNFRFGHCEIDVIARRGDVLAFIEVKTRRSRTHGHPLCAILERKRAMIRRVAEAWVARFGESGLVYRFDAISIEKTDRGRMLLSHVENAWGH